MFCIGFTACGNDDEPENPAEGTGAATSSIVGKWEITKTTYKYYTTIPEMQQYYEREEVEEGNGEYWEFTASKLIVHDPSDLLNGKAMNYTYNEKNGELKITGALTYNVTKLTSSSMTAKLESSDENYGTIVTIEFKKM